MTLKERQAKVKALEHFLGDKVRIHLKHMLIRDIDPDGDIAVGNALEGFMIDIDTAAVYMGGDPNEGFTHVIDLEIVGMINLVDGDIQEIIELLKGELPSEGDIH